MTVCFITETRTERADVPKASTKAPRKQALPHEAHIQPCCNQGENKSGVPVAGGETAVPIIQIYKQTDIKSQFRSLKKL